jgi:hypothetical protein
MPQTMPDPDRIAQAFWASVIVFSLIGVYFYLSQPAYDFGPTRWARWRAWFVQRYIAGRSRPIADLLTSSEAGDPADDQPLLDDDPATTTTPQNSNNGVAITQNDRNALLLQTQAATLAAMVKAGKIGETEGIRLVFGVAPSSSNPRYIAARAALKTELAKLSPSPYPQRTPEQQVLREQLGIEAKR